MHYNSDIFQITNNNTLPEKGNILISEPFLNDKYFGRSVVLLVEHDINHGSMGFVINKPMKEKMSDFFPELQLATDIPIFMGGPVNTNKLYYIHTIDSIPDSFPIGNGVYFDGDFDAIKSYLEEGNLVNGQIKFFLGYSGWEQNQLKHEITHNAWLVGKMEKGRIMKAEGEICWKKSLLDLGERYRSWANFPKQPSMN